MPLWRGQRQYVYYTCMRCSVRQPLSHMAWQNGILVCKDNRCIDTAIVGSRDLAVERQVSIWRHELEPDPKLINPIGRKNDQADVLY